MSCKGLFRPTYKDRRQTEEDNANTFENCIQKSDKCTKSRSEAEFEVNHNLSSITCNGENVSAAELDLPTNSNCVISNSTEVTPGVGSIISEADNWFKQKTELVSNMDLGILKSEDMDYTYLTDNIGHHFLSNRDPVDMCIVTNICDMGLGLEFPSNGIDKGKIKLSTIISRNDKDSNLTILPDFPSDEEVLLNDLTRSDLLDKDILVGNTEVRSLCPSQILKSMKQELSSNYVGSNSEHYPLIENSAALSSDAKHGEWNSSEVVGAQTLHSSIETSPNKHSWETMLTSNKQSSDLDSEKELDFPELNLFTFQIDPSDGMTAISTLHESDCDKGTGKIDFYCDDSVKHLQITNSKSPPLVKVLNDGRLDNVNEEVQTEVLPTVSNSSLTSVLKSNKLNATTNSKSLLNCPRVTSVIQAPLTTNCPAVPFTSQEVEQRSLDTIGNANPKKLTQPNSPQKLMSPSPVTIIAISTNKTKNTTEIVINTPQGEQVFKGKTSDLMKATSNLLFKVDETKQGDRAEETLTGNDDDAVAPQADMASESSDDGEMSPVKPKPEEEPIMDALSDLGINVENLFCVTTASGQKLWLCPVKDCGKMYPRQSMLRVHILAHYGVRPYRCDFPSCQWSFYTYFKLKRHKETHLKRKDFVCPMADCGRRFTTVYNLNTHQKLHTRPAEMVCPVTGCNSCFQTKRSMELHMKTHGSGHAPYKCVYEGCGKTYYSSNSLHSHTRSHQHKEEELRCQWQGCSKLFDKPCRLKAHMRSHTGDKPYPCNYQDCGWAFSSSSKLKRHQYKHTNERKFRCRFEGCGKSFMRKEHLREHTITHVAKRSFQCPIENCKVKFSAKSSLCVHLKKHSSKVNNTPPDKVEYRCPIEQCVRSYTCKSSLRQHTFKMHTPALATETSHLDYLTLLTGEEDLGLLECTHYATEAAQTSHTAGGVVVNAVGLLPPATVSGNVSVDTSEFINTDFQLPGGVVTPAVGGGGLVTHVVLTPTAIQSTSLVLPNGLSLAPELTQPDVGGLEEPEQLLLPPASLPKDSSFGSARTNYTYDDIVRQRERKNLLLPQPDPLSLEGHTDMLGPDITHSFMMQDDLAGGHHSLFHEDHVMGVGSGVSEFQVLLLDPGGSTHQEIPESTINLRDLE